MYKGIKRDKVITMNRVVEILVRRDGITEAEAKLILKDVRQMFKECNYDPDECEDIMACELGLEPDYIMDILWD